MAFTIQSISTQDRNQTIINRQGNNGPLSDLEDPAFQYKLYQYPLVENPDTPDNGHFILFYINLPEKSYWNTPDSSNILQNGPPPRANRTSPAGQFGLRNAEQYDGVTSLLPVLPEWTYKFPPYLLYKYGLKRKTKRTNAVVSLYVPNTMIFGQHIGYENVSLTNALGIGGNVLYALKHLSLGNGGYAAAASGDLLNFLKIGNVVDLKTTVEIAMQNFGIADNPQNLVLFKQIDFRKFQFDFLLTPENQDEANLIQEIIYQFRFHSAPEVAQGSLGRFMVPPSDFDIEIIHNGKVNEYLPKISTCVLESVNVDYAASGEWTTHWDGSPLQTRLTLNFTETEIMTKDKIQSGY